MELSKISAIFNSLDLVLSSEDKKKLAEISQAYFTAVDENFQLREELHKLKNQLVDKDAQIRGLNEQLAERRKLVYKNGIQGYIVELDGDEKTGAVCPCCYKEKGSIVLLEKSKDGGYCPICKSRYPGVKTSFEGRKQTVW